MRVLVVEGSPGAATTARSTLVDAGHEVTACHNGGPAFPCHALDGGPGCPLDLDGGVDVVMLVRDQVAPGPTATEDGVRCALRRRVPLAIAGEVDDNPYTEFAAVIAQDVDGVLDAVEAAANSPLAGHIGVARTALRTVLQREGVDAPDADVSVVRRGPVLTVTLLPSVALPSAVLEAASVRVLAAVRAFDHNPSIIDVTVESPAPAAR